MGAVEWLKKGGLTFHPYNLFLVECVHQFLIKRPEGLHSFSRSDVYKEKGLQL